MLQPCHILRMILLFYSLLSGVHKDDKILLMGDFNARVGIDHDIWNCLGRSGFGNQNTDGMHLLQLNLTLLSATPSFAKRTSIKGHGCTHGRNIGT